MLHAVYYLINEYVTFYNMYFCVRGRNVRIELLINQ